MSAALASPGRPVAVADPYANRYLIALTVTLASVLELVDTSIVNVAIPHMMGSLGATLDEIAWVSTGYIVANVIVLPITGWLSDVFGRRRYFAGSIALFTLASFFCGNAHTLTELVVWRIIQGLGGGALLSTSQAILYEVFPPAEYGTAMAIFGMGVMVGPTLGPTLGGYITDAYSWPWIFYINVPLGMLAFVLTLSYVKDSRYARRPGRIDLIGLALLAIGIGSLQTMLERGERLDWFQSRQVVAFGLTSAMSLVGFVWHELHTEHPVVDLRILKSRQLAAGVAFGGALGTCLYATVFVLPVYLQQVLGFTANQTGLVILPGAIASAVTMALTGRFLARRDPRPFVLLGVLLFTLAMWQWSHFTTASGYDDFFWPLIVRGIGLGLVFVPITNLALADLPMDRLPNGTGLFNLWRQLGGSLGIAISATLVSRLTTQYRGDMLRHVSGDDPLTRLRLDGIGHALIARGVPPARASQAAVAVLERQVDRQATMLAFEHIFLLFGLAFILALPMLLFMNRRRSATMASSAH